MRLWTLHPKYLDTQGLVALWREGLLAQKVLSGGTRGYTRHPQLHRFRECEDPTGTIASYLLTVADEARLRGYRFDVARVLHPPVPTLLDATQGQLEYEWDHLIRKLTVRSPRAVPHLLEVGSILPHPLFRISEGPPADWERR